MIAKRTKIDTRKTFYTVSGSSRECTASNRAEAVSTVALRRELGNYLKEFTRLWERN